MDETAKAVVAILAMAEDSPLVAFLVAGAILAVILFLLWKFVIGLAFLVEKFAGAASAAIGRVHGGAQQEEWFLRKRQFLQMLGADLTAIGKAEAWNDQQFTDLEAEVEIEGHYYPSAFARIFRKKSSGRRREPSLVDAIYGSSERCLLLIGEPGAGKSVALRHLASQMIGRSIKSKDPLAPVPLYVNFREFQVPPEKPVTADAVRQFVLDNVRHGDADIGDYVRENWADFQTRGIWFFLFDSFDEIPAVLHAAASETVVAQYAKAIQQFMDGLSDCRGVLASREYKSPTLAWPRLRILPMSEVKQEELIKRSFLTREQKLTALRAISVSNSATYTNPLFLTLLCRYVRSNLYAPANEHELLFAHVQTLTARDEEFVTRKWGFSSQSLLIGASELAKLFAQAPELGLSPTLVDLRAACVKRGMGEFEATIERLVEALTYVKVGRNDVVSTNKNVRRFAFAHRRYQECLFAAYLAANQGAISVREVITDSRWRDYLVALLQISQPARREEIVAEARAVISERIDVARFRHRKYLGVEFQSWDWRDPVLEHVVGVFLEAKRYWPEGPWASIAPECERFLAPLWSKGDYQDRRKVLEYCGVGDSNELAKRLKYGIFSGIPMMEEAAVDAAQFLLQPSPEFAARVRESLVARMLTSRKRFELLRWEAVAAQLPASYHMSACIDRAKSLSSQGALARFVLAAFEAIDRVLATAVSSLVIQAHRSEVRKKISTLGLMSLGALWGMLVCLIALASLFSADTFTRLHAVFAVLLSALMAYLAIYIVRLECAAVPAKLSITVLRHYVRDRFGSAVQSIPGFALFCVFSVLPGAIVAIFAKLLGYKVDLVDLIVGGSTIFYVLLVVAVWVFMVRGSKSVCAVAAAQYQSASSPQKAMGTARHGSEIVAMSREVAARCESAKELRQVIAYLSALKRVSESAATEDWKKKIRGYDLRTAISNVMHALDEREKAGS